jgi:hypothetical protein
MQPGQDPPQGVTRENGQSTASLVGGIVQDARDLLAAELKSAKIEVKQELEEAKKAAISFAIGASLAAVGGLMLLLTIVFLLATYTDLPLWASFAIVGVVLAVVGGVMLVMGKKQAKDVDLVPQKTIEDAKEDVRWMKERLSSSK